MNLSKGKMLKYYPQGQTVYERVERMLRYQKGYAGTRHAITEKFLAGELAKMNLKLEDVR